MLALQCLLFAVVAGRISSSSSTGQWEHITHPKRLLQQKLSTEETPHSSLDTRARESGRETLLHLAQSTFQIEAFGSTYILDLQLNHDLLSSDYVERHFDKEGKPSQTAGGEHCYYHGSLRGNPRSWAALATCQGLHGMFSDGVFSYIIEPLINKTDQFVQLRRSTTQTRNFAKAVVNMADAIYKEQLNTRIVLVAMETWTSGNPVSVVPEPLITLQNFMQYRRESVQENPDSVQLLSGSTFQSSRSGSAYTGGVCSITQGGGINEYGSVGSVAVSLCQSLGQNIGMKWNNIRNAAGKAGESDLEILETIFHPIKQNMVIMKIYCFYKLLDPPECGNGFVEPGEECDCGSQECARSGGACCKKCTLTHDAMCSNGLCCRECRYEQRGVMCRDAVNDCDIPETCTGDSSQCPHNVHKLDGYMCDNNQGRCYNGRCRTLDNQCRSLWGYSAADRFCYEKLNAEGTEKGNCGRAAGGQSWIQCNKPDVLCGFLFCSNVTEKPKFGDLQGELTSLTIYHQNKYLDCRGGHAVLEDGSDLGYVEDGTPCGPSMMCLERRCLPLSSFNISTCPGSNSGPTCSNHGVRYTHTHTYTHTLVHCVSEVADKAAGLSSFSML
uniref:ADAM metallopeptidase domain 11 n=1 Tax=Astyanax mexicanus TaxID=7994 RepID=A0A8B9KII4_ASTMX